MRRPKRNRLGLVLSAGLLASILAAGTAPAALAAATVVASSPGTFVQSAGFATAATYAVTESGINGWSDSGNGFLLDIKIANPSISYDTGTAVTLAGPASLGASVTFINPQTLRFTAAASDTLNQEGFSISLERVKATCAAPLGPVDTRYEYVASPGNPSIFGSIGGPPFSFPSLGTVTAGNCPHGTICVVKFNDLDGDGQQGPNEPSLSGWVFTIKDANGNVVGTITTGDFAANCIDLPAGTYVVTETLQAGWTPTTPGADTQTVTVLAGQTTSVSFGNHTEHGRICIVKFNDLDGDGKQDPGEPLLPNWVFAVIDTASNTMVGTLISGTKHNCIDVKPGIYAVAETLQAGWLPTTPGGVTQTAVVVAGQTTNVTFGNHRCCLTFTFLGGKIDNFSTANGATAEPATPVSITAPAYFDATKGDRAFAHRFYLGAGNCIQSASLEIRIKALPGGSTNDAMGIKVPGSSSWSKSISAVAPTGTWTPPKVKTVLFNLGAMPSGGGSTNLIPALNSIRVLDINIQDDTSVDYIKLIVVFCECVRTTTLSAPSGVTLRLTGAPVIQAGPAGYTVEAPAELTNGSTQALYVLSGLALERTDLTLSGTARSTCRHGFLWFHWDCWDFVNCSPDVNVLTPMEIPCDERVVHYPGMKDPGDPTPGPVPLDGGGPPPADIVVGVIASHDLQRIAQALDMDPSQLKLGLAPLQPGATVLLLLRGRVVADAAPASATQRVPVPSFAIVLADDVGSDSQVLFTPSVGVATTVP